MNFLNKTLISITLSLMFTSSVPVAAPLQEAELMASYRTAYRVSRFVYPDTKCFTASNQFVLGMAHRKKLEIADRYMVAFMERFKEDCRVHIVGHYPTGAQHWLAEIAVLERGGR